jgi:hypothetical protein
MLRRRLKLKRKKKTRSKRKIERKRRRIERKGESTDIIHPPLQIVNDYNNISKITAQTIYNINKIIIKNLTYLK